MNTATHKSNIKNKKKLIVKLGVFIKRESSKIFLYKESGKTKILYDFNKKMKVSEPVFLFWDKYCEKYRISFMREKDLELI